MDEQWMEELRQKMSDYRWPGPELSWDELDRALMAGQARKARQLWLRRLAAAAVVLLIAGVGFWTILHDETEQMRPTASAVERHLGDGNLGDWHNDSSAAKIRVPVPVIPSASEPEVVALISTATPDTVDTAEVTDQEQPKAVEQKAKPAKQPLPVIYPSDLRQQKHLDNRLTAKVYMSSTMAGNQTEHYGMSGVYLASISDDPLFHELQAPIEHFEQYVHHRQPVRFGLSLRYRLDDRWSIESGLSYTRLSSDITTTVNDVMRVTEQRLNYIGLPLNISYDLWKSRHFGLYVTAGGTIEKQLDASPWQFSLNGAAGAEYKLSNSFSLYAEPGLGYYFKDGSSTPTIYKDHPLNFNLNIGLRFNLK